MCSTLQEKKGKSEQKGVISWHLKLATGQEGQHAHIL
jgi:hypothetical protein